MSGIRTPTAAEILEEQRVIREIYDLWYARGFPGTLLFSRKDDQVRAVLQVNETPRNMLKLLRDLTFTSE